MLNPLKGTLKQLKKVLLKLKEAKTELTLTEH
jgi:hypothetical protein